MAKEVAFGQSGMSADATRKDVMQTQPHCLQSLAEKVAHSPPRPLVSARQWPPSEAPSLCLETRNPQIKRPGSYVGPPG